MLDVYSRYCRLCFDDLEMRNKYREEIDRIKALEIDVKKWEVDSVKLEMDFGSTESALALMKRYFGALVVEDQFEAALKEMESKVDTQRDLKIFDFRSKFEIRLQKRTSKKVAFQISSSQNFAFQLSLLYYILKNSNSRMLQKLYGATKWFYAFMKTPVCRRLEILPFEATVSYQEALFVAEKDLHIIDISKLHLSNTLFIDECEDRGWLSKFIPKIYKCEIKHLTIRGQELSLFEFDFLASDVEKFDGRECTIKYQNNILSAMEVFDRMSKLTKIYYSVTDSFYNQEESIPPKTSQEKRKYSVCEITNISEAFETDILSTFIKVSTKNRVIFNSKNIHLG